MAIQLIPVFPTLNIKKIVLAFLELIIQIAFTYERTEKTGPYDRITSSNALNSSYTTQHIRIWNLDIILVIYRGDVP